ncbi:MAG: hypothetical protein NTX72_02595 [Candidatus Uhrbacteria bacterium]|nr:hypothetical protein [Candidatus Uhrbacteria bacterium]
MRILVPYQASEQGFRHIRFAGDVSSRMGVSLSVLLPSVSAEESERIRSLVLSFGFMCDVIAADIETMTNESGSIYVLNTFPKRMDLTILSPFWESAWLRSAEHRVLIPFGGRDAGRFATATVMPIMKALGFHVIFYHTTWREGIRSVDPADHMAREARLTQRIVEGLARDAGVPYTVLIETAEDVTEGIILAALNLKASLIVTTHGLNVIAGSYATQLRIGPVPLLTIGRTEVKS